MKVNTTLRGGRFSGEFRQVLVAGQGGGVENDLVKISRFVELLDGGEGFLVPGIKGESVREVDL